MPRLFRLRCVLFVCFALLIAAYPVSAQDNPTADEPHPDAIDAQHPAGDNIPPGEAPPQQPPPTTQPAATQPAATAPADRSPTTQSADTAPASQPPATQPATTQPAEITNPLPSPAALMQYFLETTRAGRYAEAQIALNFDQVDPDVRRTKGAEYVETLALVVEELIHKDHFDPAKLPDDPTAPTQSFGKDPLLLYLERQAETTEGGVRLWQFSATTVKDIPALPNRLAALQIQQTQPAPTPAPPAAGVAEETRVRLRSPYHLVQYFLVKVGEAERDASHYAEAMRCLDFSQAEIESLETQGPERVDQLAILIAHLREDGFDRETLPREPEPELDRITLGQAPLLITLVRQDDDRWRFSADTVRRIPEMIADLQRSAEQAAEAGEPPLPPVAAGTMRLDTSSPQATLNLFLTSMNAGDIDTAVETLNLAGMSDAERQVAGLIAGKMWMVLNRDELIVLQDIPSDPETAEPYTLVRDVAGRIEIGRVTTGPRAGEWLFTSPTVRSAERLYDAWESKPIAVELADERISFFALPSLHVREYWVPTSWKREVFGFDIWQWVGVLLVLLAGVVAWIIAYAIFPPITRKMLSSEGAQLLPRVARNALKPTANFVMVLTWWTAIQLLDLGAVTLSWINWVLQIATAIIGVHATYRLVELIASYLRGKAALTQSRLDDVLVPLAQKTLKVLVVTAGVLVVATAFGFEIGPLLAGVGLGGLAFGLAAQDTLKNFFGSVNVVLDRPFQVGDWVRIGDQEGTVETVGLRSSTLRTFYNSQIIIPNSSLMTAHIDNLGRRQYRRISCMISVQYDTTPARLDAFCEGIRQIIRMHPYTRKDYYHCYVNKFAASSIDILLYVFHETPDWSTELRERHRLFLDIIRLAQRLGVRFAFPTTTVHLHHESTPPDAPPPPAESPPELPDDAQYFGKREAERLVREIMGDDPQKPPPVTF